jgi:hypothetical protein
MKKSNEQIERELIDATNSVADFLRDLDKIVDEARARRRLHVTAHQGYTTTNCPLCGAR